MSGCITWKICIFFATLKSQVESVLPQSKKFDHYSPLDGYRSLANVISDDKYVSLGECGQKFMKCPRCAAFHYNILSLECLLVSSRTPQSVQREFGWKYYLEPLVSCPITFKLNSTLRICYKHNTDLMTSVDAEYFCRQNGSRMLYIDSMEKQYAMGEIFRDNGNDDDAVSIDGIYNSTTGTWHTYFGQEMTFFHWGQNEPANLSIKKRIRLFPISNHYGSYVWKSSRGTEQSRAFICETI